MNDTLISRLANCRMMVAARLRAVDVAAIDDAIAALAQPAVSDPITDPLALAILFHHTYERLAPSIGYDTRTETRIFDPESKNGKLMVAVCREILANAHLTQPAVPPREPLTDEQIIDIIHPIADVNIAFHYPDEIVQAGRALLAAQEQKT